VWGDEPLTEDIKKKDQSGNKNRKDNLRVRHNPKMHSNQLSPKFLLKSLGPGLVTGASDDDPSGIATFSQAGARFGFGMLWLVLFQYPLMTAIQEMCARIGLVTGRGLAAVINENYSRKVVFPLIGLLFIANTINIGTDIGAMSASTRLLIPPSTIFCCYYNLCSIYPLSTDSNPLQEIRKSAKVSNYFPICIFHHCSYCRWQLE